MFYVIGSENSKSGSAFYSSRQQNQRHGGAVRHFRCTDTVSDETDLWWNIGIQLCHHYTDTSLIRQVSECLSVFGISKSSFQRDRKKIPLLVRTFRSDLSTGFGKQSAYTSRRNFQIRTLLNIFFDPFFQGVLCLNLNGWLFISQVVAGEKRLLSIVLLKW